MRKILTIASSIALSFVSSASWADSVNLQQKFSDIVSEYAQKYDDAPNELKKSSVMRQRDEALKALLPKSRFEKWIFPILKLGTTGDGNAYIILGGKNIPFTIGTMNNEFSDSSAGTLIKHGTPMYDVLSDLDKGQEVIVSGRLLEVIAITERGKMVDPDFTAKFSSIEPKK